MIGGERHEHIAEVKWRNVRTQDTGRSSRAEMVGWLERSTTNKAIVGDYPTDYVYVGVVHPKNSDPYIRTYANKEWTDNLLSLPEY